MNFYRQILKVNKAFIIAEAGVNHNGKLNLALKLVDIAKKAGCDAVKFQTFKTENVISKGTKKAAYQLKNISITESQFDMIKKLELSEDAHIILARYCRKKGILFVSTPCDEYSVKLLNKLNVPFFKVGSAEVTNLPFLKYVAEQRKPIILSTGMANLREIRQAVETIYGAGNKKLILLHCVTDYPVPADDVNLKTMLTLKKIFKTPIGYSDHSLGVEIPLAAVALGAKVVEKHFTLNKNMKGPDHKTSLNPQELSRVVKGIRIIEKALGNGVKKLSLGEKKNMKFVRRSIVALQNITKGEVITPDVISCKRPGWGIQPKDIDKIIGCKARGNIKKDEVIVWRKIEK